MSARKRFVILMAEDDEDDRQFAKEAFDECAGVDLRFVVHGEELMEYLRRQGAYGDATLSPRPSIILLDLNMPKKSGREALREIRDDPTLRRVPVVVLTTSKADEDIAMAYDLGANSFIAKPVELTNLTAIVKIFNQYWFETAALPPIEDPRCG